ncbi:hypothetical protein [Pseudothauera rhizosphaerae]|uniref:Uncharacterized protein n=1 Tax=Pseudothauera rhizosphaerae TaxID=2565932 RepID=A0A4S4AY99_9RHOO|nr:hypothetical protein [Pseudothauera rhizosphaerae]THF64308.1 hypothetical protein E6O51_03075 [Pseudothauera rhizosphaerae]
MAHFAQIDESNTVLQVLVVPDEQEHRGAEFLADDLGLGGTWVQCSYNASIRKQFPGAGFAYDPDADVFVAPPPFPSWVLDENHDWQPPVQRPDEGRWRWDEATVSWVEVA